MILPQACLHTVRAHYTAAVPEIKCYLRDGHLHASIYTLSSIVHSSWKLGFDIRDGNRRGGILGTTAWNSLGRGSLILLWTSGEKVGKISCADKPAALETVTRMTRPLHMPCSVLPCPAPSRPGDGVVLIIAFVAVVVVCYRPIDFGMWATCP